VLSVPSGEHILEKKIIIVEFRLESSNAGWQPAVKPRAARAASLQIFTANGFKAGLAVGYNQFKGRRTLR
jgi:hypothetical protein